MSKVLFSSQVKQLSGSGMAYIHFFFSSQ